MPSIFEFQVSLNEQNLTIYDEVLQLTTKTDPFSAHREPVLPMIKTLGVLMRIKDLLI